MCLFRHKRHKSDGDLGHCLLTLVEGKHDCTGEKVQHHVPSTVTCAVFENVVEIS